jgi:hypothetical protein
LRGDRADRLSRPVVAAAAFQACRSRPQRPPPRGPSGSAPITTWSLSVSPPRRCTPPTSLGHPSHQTLIRCTPTRGQPAIPPTLSPSPAKARKPQSRRTQELRRRPPCRIRQRRHRGGAAEAHRGAEQDSERHTRRAAHVGEDRRGRRPAHGHLRQRCWHGEGYLGSSHRRRCGKRGPNFCRRLTRVRRRVRRSPCRRNVTSGVLAVSRARADFA